MSLRVLLHILVMWVDQDMSVVIWIPRYFTEFTCDSSVSGLIKSCGVGIELHYMTDCQCTAKTKGLV